MAKAQKKAVAGHPEPVPAPVGSLPETVADVVTVEERVVVPVEAPVADSLLCLLAEAAAALEPSTPSGVDIGEVRARIVRALRERGA